MNKTERRMLDILSKGAESYGFDAVKAEFEAEGTRSDEFLRLLEIARRAGVKVGLKIGGAEAVRDLIEARQFGVDYIIAPMVETPYALSKYIAAKDAVYSADERQDTDFLFNVETITTLENIEAMADAAASPKGCDGMVFGRVDFAGSLNIPRAEIDGDTVTRSVLKAARIAAKRDLTLVVGGAISAASVEPLRALRRVRLDRFETRKIIFDAGVLEGDAVQDALALAIEFELLWLTNKRSHYALMALEDEARIEMLEARSRRGGAAPAARRRPVAA